MGTREKDPTLKPGGMNDVGAGGAHRSTVSEVKEMGKEERFVLALKDA